MHGLPQHQLVPGTTVPPIRSISKTPIERHSDASLGMQRHNIAYEARRWPQLPTAAYSSTYESIRRAWAKGEHSDASTWRSRTINLYHQSHMSGYHHTGVPRCFLLFASASAWKPQAALASLLRYTQPCTYIELACVPKILFPWPDQQVLVNCLYRKARKR